MSQKKYRNSQQQCESIYDRHIKSLLLFPLRIIITIQHNLHIFRHSRRLMFPMFVWSPFSCCCENCGIIYPVNIFLHQTNICGTRFTRSSTLLLLSSFTLIRELEGLLSVHDLKHNSYKIKTSFSPVNLLLLDILIY